MSETHAVVADLRRRGAEPTQVEVKAAAGGMPKSLKETLSAFSNGEGGIVLLGLSEDEDFTPVASFDADAIRDAAAGMAADSMTPAVRCEIAIEPFEGARIVRIDVPVGPLPRAQGRHAANSSLRGRPRGRFGAAIPFDRMQARPA